MTNVPEEECSVELGDVVAGHPELAQQYVRLIDTTGMQAAVARTFAQTPAMVELSKTVAAMQRSLVPPKAVDSLLTASRLLDTSGIAKAMAAHLAMPKISALMQPALSTGVQSMFAAITASMPKLSIDVGPLQSVLAEYARTTTKWADLVKGIEGPSVSPLLPANLRGLDVDLEQVAVLVHDGITVYGVPGPRIAARLLAAPDRQHRRAILGRELVRVADDCDVALDGCVVPETREAVTFARKAIRAVRNGHVEAAQALASNALDSQMCRWFTGPDYVAFTSHRKTTVADVDAWDLRTHMALGPVWAAHEQYEPGGTALIPQTYARHASTHAVSGRQYNRRNAAQAVMLLTSLVVYSNEGLGHL